VTPLFEVHPVTGASIEVFYSDTGLATFGWGGAGYFWQVRRRGFAAEGAAHGPFPTSYSAYRSALLSPVACQKEHNSKVNTDTVRTPRNGLGADYI
jgi:hypothetical protein